MVRLESRSVATTIDSTGKVAELSDVVGANGVRRDFRCVDTGGAWKFGFPSYSSRYWKPRAALKNAQLRGEGMSTRVARPTSLVPVWNDRADGSLVVPRTVRGAENSNTRCGEQMVVRFEDSGTPGRRQCVHP